MLINCRNTKEHTNELSHLTFLDKVIIKCKTEQHLNELSFILDMDNADSHLQDAPWAIRCLLHS